MVASHISEGTANSEYICGSLPLRGAEFPFYLKQRKVNLGSAGKIQFFYMPPSLLRSNDPGREESNFRSCIGFWFAGMQEIGAADEWEQQRHYVMASSHALFNRDKGPQSIYRDAFLRYRSFDIKDISLPDEVRARIRNAVQGRDRDAVKRELDDAFSVAVFDRGDLLGFQKTFAMWVDKGMNALRQQGEEGVIEWLKEIDYWIKKYRKKSDPRVRRFVNFFEYQAKTSFYLCYASFWSSLIPWLQEHYALDEPSKRFLSFWHNQNQPIEIPHGRTRGEIIYPTRGRFELLLPDEDPATAQRRLEWKTDHIGPKHVPDVFAGQVLALHPLSWILLSDPALREAVGRCVTSPFFTRLLQDGSVELFSEYWGMIDAILTAAQLYRHARDDYENRRGVCEVGGDATKGVTSDENEVVEEKSTSTDTLLRNYVLAQKQVCDCAGSYEFRGIVFGPPEEHQQDTCELLLQCVSCSSQKQLAVTEQQVWSFLHE